MTVRSHKLVRVFYVCLSTVVFISVRIARRFFERDCVRSRKFVRVFFVCLSTLVLISVRTACLLILCLFVYPSFDFRTALWFFERHCEVTQVRSCFLCLFVYPSLEFSQDFSVVL